MWIEYDICCVDPSTGMMFVFLSPRCSNRSLSVQLAKSVIIIVLVIKDSLHFVFTKQLLKYLNCVLPSSI